MTNVITVVTQGPQGTGAAGPTGPAGTNGSPHYLNVKDAPYNAVGDGVTDDTAAIQAALTHIQTGSYCLVIPRGTYLITSTLLIIGNNPSGFRIQGETAGPDREGAMLFWGGAAGGRIMEWRGVSASNIENVAFYGNALAKYGLRLRSNQTFGGTGSSGCIVSLCSFTGFHDIDSVAIEIGEVTGGDTLQSDSHVIRDCYGSGPHGYASPGDPLGTCAFIRTLQAGNTKCFIFERNRPINWSYMFDLQETDGICNIWGGGGTSQVCDIVYGGGVLNVCGFQTEVSPKFIQNTMGFNHSAITVMNSSWIGTTDTNDTVIEVQGHLTLIGNVLWNQRTGTSQARIKMTGDYFHTVGTHSTTSIVSHDNYYVQAAEFAPFYWGTNAILGDDVVTYFPLQVSSRGDTGGTNGATVDLRPVEGIPQSYPYLGMLHPLGYTSSGITNIINAEPRGPVTVAKTISYTAFSAAATSKELQLFRLKEKQVIHAIWVETTTPFTGSAGTVQLRVGHTAGGQEYILAHDVKSAAVIKGFADADLGTSLARANLVQGADWAAWSPASNGYVYVKLVSGTGNTSTITAGSVTIYVLTSYYGVGIGAAT